MNNEAEPPMTMTEITDELTKALLNFNLDIELNREEDSVSFSGSLSSSKSVECGDQE